MVDIIASKRCRLLVDVLDIRRMSGYRLIHREQVLDEETAIWSLVTTPLLGRCRTPPQQHATAAADADESLSWRVWAACSDGYIRSYLVREVSLAQKESSLTASALRFGTTTGEQQQHQQAQPSHILKLSSDETAVALGCASLSILRNYAGQDEAAGKVMVAGMDLSGILRIWELEENMDEQPPSQVQPSSSDHDDPVVVRPIVELTLSQATGTTVALAPPRTILPNHHTTRTLLVAVAFLDGSVSLVSTGIPVPSTNMAQDPKAKLPPAGTIVDSWGTGSALACRLVFRPNVAQLAVSRQDGTVDLISINDNSNEAKQRLHRLSQLATSPSRALTFTTDGNLMIAGNDQGRLVLWDVSRPNGVPAVVNHRASAVAGSAWLWQLAPLDGRRFVSLATDKTIRVWQVDQVHNQPLHSFTSSDDIRLWSLSRPALESNRNPHPPRMVTGSENGWLQAYSLVEKS